MDSLRIFQWQMAAPVQKETALNIAEEGMAKAAAEKADLFCLPEMFCCPYETPNFPLYAEEEGGFLWTSLSQLAKKYHLYVSAGSIPEKDEQGRIYNTAYVFDRSGKQIAKHRKVHLFDIQVEGGQSFRESDTLSAGNAVTVFDTEFGKMGLCVCYDFRFPELARLMALKGAKVIVVPAAFNQTTGPAHWELLFRSQSMFHQVFAIGTAPSLDPASSYHAWGHSIVTGPWGDVISQMDEKSGGRLTQIDFTQVEVIRQQLPLLYHRREDVYTLAEVSKK